MDWVLYALVQGLFEWLPVSSSGILVLLGMNIGKALAAHLATGVAGATYLVLRYRRRAYDLLTRWGLLPLLSGAPVALLLEHVIRGVGEDRVRLVTLYLYLVTLAALLAGLVGMYSRSSGRTSLRDALVVGLLEGVAVLPGVSRSGMVAAYLLLRGYHPRLLVGIVIASGTVAGLAAGLYELLSGSSSIPLLFNIVVYIAAMVSAFLLERVGEEGKLLLSMIVVAGLLLGALSSVAARG